MSHYLYTFVIVVKTFILRIPSLYMPKNLNLLTYCGGSCDRCQIYLATRETDKEKQEAMRKEIAEFASKYYDKTFKPEDITDCDGYSTIFGRLFSGARKCIIRPCARKKGYLNCARCPKYPLYSRSFSSLTQLLRSISMILEVNYLSPANL